MQCMKCGREIPVGQAFCEECLTEMAAYPVKPGTVVTLPSRPKQSAPKKTASHRPTVSLESQVKKQGKTIRALSWLLTLSTAMLIGVSALAVSLLTEEPETEKPGQNYSAEGETRDPPEWNIDRSDVFDNTSDPTEDTNPIDPDINGFEGG